MKIRRLNDSLNPVDIALSFREAKDQSGDIPDSMLKSFEDFIYAEFEYIKGDLYNAGFVLMDEKAYKSEFNLIADFEKELPIRVYNGGHYSKIIDWKAENRLRGIMSYYRAAYRLPFCFHADVTLSDKILENSFYAKYKADFAETLYLYKLLRSEVLYQSAYMETYSKNKGLKKVILDNLL